VRVEKRRTEAYITTVDRKGVKEETAQEEEDDGDPRTRWTIWSFVFVGVIVLGATVFAQTKETDGG